MKILKIIIVLLFIVFLFGVLPRLFDNDELPVIEIKDWDIKSEAIKKDTGLNFDEWMQFGKDFHIIEDYAVYRVFKENPEKRLTKKDSFYAWFGNKADFDPECMEPFYQIGWKIKIPSDVSPATENVFRIIEKYYQDNKINELTQLDPSRSITNIFPSVESILPIGVFTLGKIWNKEVDSISVFSPDLIPERYKGERLITYVLLDPYIADVSDGFWEIRTQPFMLSSTRLDINEFDNVKIICIDK